MAQCDSALADEHRANAKAHDEEAAKAIEQVHPRLQLRAIRVDDRDRDDADETVERVELREHLVFHITIATPKATCTNIVNCANTVNHHIARMRKLGNLCAASAHSPAIALPMMTTQAKPLCNSVNVEENTTDITR